VLVDERISGGETSKAGADNHNAPILPPLRQRRKWLMFIVTFGQTDACVVGE
jgi:hypothetical protein